MARKAYLLIATCLLLALPLLAACGQNAAGNGSNGGPQGPGGNGTETRATPVVSPDVKGTRLPGTSGPVTLELAGSSYKTGDIITVTVSNQSGRIIEFADHATECSVVLMQQKVSWGWSSVRPCKLMTATRLHELGAGQKMEVKVGGRGAQWQAGTYRFTLSYRGVGSGLTTIDSQEFQVA